jgi:hypothetical protein
VDKKRKHIDDFFRDKMGHYAEVPPSDAWADMDKRLDILKPATVPTNPYRWMGHFGMVSVVAILGVTAVRHFSNLAVTEAEQPAQPASAITSPSVVASAGNVAITSPAADDVIESDTRLADAVTTTVAGNRNEEQPRHEQLAFGESYAENADEEYVEGVTPIRKEDINDTYEPGHGKSGSAQYVLSANGTGALLAYAGNDLNPVGSNVYSSKTLSKLAGSQSVTAAAIKDQQKSIPPLAAEKSTKADKMNAPRTRENKWELGINAGYERGFSNEASRSVAIAPWAGYKLGKRFSVMAQPTVKFANAPVRQIGEAQQYYNTIGEPTVQAVESYVTSAVEGTRVTYYNNTRYRYSQQYNTIERRNMTGGRYVQLELPVSAAYRLTQRVKVYGGVNLAYGKSQAVKEEVSVKSGLIATRDVLVTTTGTPEARDASEVLQYQGTPGSQYSGPIYPSTRSNLLRVGASAGVSWQYSNRWLLDAMVQQTPAPAAVRGGYNVNAPMAAPVFRLSVGYKIVK